MQFPLRLIAWDHHNHGPANLRVEPVRDAKAQIRLHRNPIATMPIKSIQTLSEVQIDRVIHMAWSDRMSFETIREHMHLTESEVIQLMRAQLRRKSFNIWRKRVSGRTTKHRKRFWRARASLHRLAITA